MTPQILEGKREGSYLFDTEGKRYLDGDTSAGIFNLGRRHPELAEELKRAMRVTDQGNFPIISEEKALLGEALANFVPGPLECSLYAVTRGEAFDAACKVVRGFTKRPGLVSVDGGWYGQTGFALGLSQRDDRALYEPLMPESSFIAFGDLEDAARVIGSQTAAVFIEPVQAENGCRQATREYVAGLEKLCRERGALLVIDETQTNFGRTGTRFYFEQLGVSPDILLIGEALGGGMFPIAVTMMTQRVNRFMNDHPLIHMSTFGGSDLGCCVARKALEIYEREKPWDKAKETGAALKKGLEAIAQQSGGAIVSVNGVGMLLALATPSPEKAAALCAALLKHGLLAGQGKVAKHCVMLRPSLLLTASEVEELVASVAAGVVESTQ